MTRATEMIVSSRMSGSALAVTRLTIPAERESGAVVHANGEGAIRGVVTAR